MSGRGRLRDTYAAALQHDLVELDGTERLVGVVRRPLPWLRAGVDENLPALGPPPDLLDAFKRRYETLRAEGTPDAEAHNRALDDVDYVDRYLSYLDASREARAAVRYVDRRLERGEDVVLVCYENTDEKRCHRTLLADHIRDR
ncbi:MAG: DUF488 family protein [Haloarculaceae archaeon]